MRLPYFLRTLARTPGFTGAAVLTLALGIGMNTVVFSLYNAVALKPLAIRAPQQVVRLFGPTAETFSYAEYDQIRLGSAAFSSIIATSDAQTIQALAGAAKRQPDLLKVRLVSSNYFEALGVSPSLGRAFAANETSAAVVSDRYWRRRLESSATVLGQTIVSNGTAFTIVGVTPEKFAGTGLPPEAPDVWLPLSSAAAASPARQWQVLARLKPGIGFAQAAASLDVLARALPPYADHPIRLRIRPATFFQTDGGEFETFTAVSGVLMVAVALVLLIGAVNVVTLLLARNAGRRQEIAVRLSLGARRVDLIRQLCGESVVLGLAGGAAGTLLAMWSSEWVRAWITTMAAQISGGSLGVSLDVSPDWRVLLYTAAVSLITGIATGLWPALRAVRTDVNAALKRESGAAPGGRRGRNWLLAAQVACCLILLTGAGLLFRGTWRAGAIDPGFDVRHIALMGVGSKPTPVANAAYLRLVTARLQELPEVVSVAAADRPPFLGHGTGPIQSDSGANMLCTFNGVSGTYLETLGIPLLAGRNFSASEIQQGSPVAIVSEAAARRLWARQDPLGKRISAGEWLTREGGHDSLTVIGVARNARTTWLSKLEEGFVYFPKPPARFAGFLLVRTRTAPEGVFHAAIDAFARIDPTLPARASLITLEQGPIRIQELMAQASAAVAAGLGLMGLLLAAVGVYGVVTFLVTQRTREIGIRIAVGAQKRDVTRLILGQSLRPVLWGGAVGLAGSLGVASLLSALVVMPDVPDFTYGAGGFHPAAFVGALAVLALAVAAASFVPVRRAAGVDPAVSLRDE